MILAGDIGGTKTNLAIFETDGKSVGSLVTSASFPSTRFSSLESILSEFLKEVRQPITAAGFGIAGPIKNQSVSTPNLKWVIAGSSLASLLKLDRISMINDLEANAYGIELVKPDKIYTLNEGDEEKGANRALISAGTGLGMAGLFHDGQTYHPMASEGGHADLAPRNETEIRMLRYLHARPEFGGHVSYERVLSGPGLFNIYSFFRDEEPTWEEPWLAAEIAAGDKSAAVSKAGIAGTSALANLAVEQFVRFYGAAAGNLALMMKALGGLYVGGGIAPKMLDKLKTGPFLRAFHDKGRLSALVKAIPVRVILDDKCALYGAARSALLRRP